MSRTYRVTGINLKSMPLGEHDRLMTVLTPERGLIRMVATGCRKPKSKLGGRTALFVTNELLVSRGKSLDRLSQAETLKSYPGLSRHFGLLTASQYLAEIVLHQGLEDRPQAELFTLFCEHLDRLEALPKNAPLSRVIAHLVQGTFHLLALEGVAPQVHACCLSQKAIVPEIGAADWQAGFSIRAGGVVTLENFNRLKDRQMQQWSDRWDETVAERPERDYEAIANRAAFLPTPNRYVNATQLTLLQQLAQPTLPDAPDSPTVERAWIAIEQLLREYTQHHLGRAIRSATLINSYIASAVSQISPAPSPSSPSSPFQTRSR